MNANSNSDTQVAPISDWALERYLLGESSAEEFAAISAQERGDEALRGRVTALRKSDAEILEAYPPACMARRVKAAYAEKLARAERKWQGPEWIRWFAVPAAACAALLVLLPIGMRSFESADGTADVPAYEDRVKGVGLTAPVIEVWRNDGGTANKLAPSSVAKAGDIVQLRYAVPAFCYGALVSMDGRGLLTVHLSGEAGKAAPLAPGNPVALDMSYKLDDAPLFEVFYLITASQNFDVDSVTRPLEKADHPIDRWDEPLQTKITAFTLRKARDGAEN